MARNKGNSYTETELLSGLTGDLVQQERWTRRLLQQYGGYVFQGMKSFNVSKEAAKDAYTDAVLAVVRQVRDGRFRGDSKLGTYLYRIFSNYCIKQFHKEERQLNWVYEIPHLTDASRSRLEEMMVAEDIAQLYQWLAQLGESCKEILILREFQGLSPEEIAKKIGFNSAHSVSSKRHRCLQRLKALIHKEKSEKTMPES